MHVYIIHYDPTLKHGTTKNFDTHVWTNRVDMCTNESRTSSLGWPTPIPNSLGDGIMLKM